MVALDPRINPVSTRDRRETFARPWSRPSGLSRHGATRCPEPVTALRRTPSHDARLDSEALPGERAMVAETTEEGWAWGRLENDGYCVGWVSANSLGPSGPAPTRKVVVLRAFAFPGPDIRKPPPIAGLPMGARGLTIARQDERSAVTASGWHVPAVCLAP